MEGLKNYFEGESDGGSGRMREDLKNAQADVDKTWDNVEQIGAKYGAAI